MKDQFIIFLVQNRALDKFKANLSDSGPLATAGFDQHIDDNGYPDDYILFAFDWELSPEGDEYWANLSDDWRKIALKLNSNLK